MPRMKSRENTIKRVHARTPNAQGGGRTCSLNLQSGGGVDSETSGEPEMLERGQWLGRNCPRKGNKWSGGRECCQHRKRQENVSDRQAPSKRARKEGRERRPHDEGTFKRTSPKAGRIVKDGNGGKTITKNAKWYQIK